MSDPFDEPHERWCALFTDPERGECDCRPKITRCPPMPAKGLALMNDYTVRDKASIAGPNAPTSPEIGLLIGWTATNRGPE